MSVDTHGYTDFGVTCSKIAGFDLCPRVHGMNDRKLHVLGGTQVPESIADHVVEDASLKSVREHWSALLRMVATFESAWTSATQLLGIYGSAARGKGVYLAGNSLGKLLTPKSSTTTDKGERSPRWQPKNFGRCTPATYCAMTFSNRSGSRPIAWPSNSAYHGQRSHRSWHVDVCDGRNGIAARALLRDERTSLAKPAIAIRSRGCHNEDRQGGDPENSSTFIAGIG